MPRRAYCRWQSEPDLPPPCDVEIPSLTADILEMRPCIRNTRTIPLEPVQYRANWENSKHFMTQEAAQKLNAMMEKEAPAAKLGHSTVQAEIKSIQLQPGTQSTYQVRWVEEEFSLSGGMSGQKASYVALFTVKIDPPTKESELLINLLGLKKEATTNEMAVPESLQGAEGRGCSCRRCGCRKHGRRGR